MTHERDPGGIRARLQQNDEATKLYRLLVSSGKLKSHLRLTYRGSGCRCTLLHVLTVPAGTMLGWPRYKNSPDRNDATSSANGRAKNTEDGDRRWRTRATIADLVDGAPYIIQCDHRTVQISVAQLTADLAAGHAEVSVDGQVLYGLL